MRSIDARLSSTHSDVVRIAALQLNELTKQLAQQHISLHINDKAIEYLAEQGYVKEHEARPLKRIINALVTVPVSHYLLQNPHIKEIHVAYKKNELIIS